MLGFVAPAHHAVGLRQTGKSIERGRIQLKTLLVGVGGLAVFAIEPRRVPEQEPELGIVRSRLCSALGIVERKRVISTLQRQLRCAREAGILDVRAPTQRLTGRRCLIGMGLRLRGSVRSYLVGLRLDGEGKCDKQGHACNLQACRSSNQTGHQG